MAACTPGPIENGEMRQQLELFVDLLGVYTSVVLNGRALEEATHGGLTPSQHEAMVFIQRHGGCSAKALSEGLHISIPSSTRLVDRLVRKSLVDRRESGADRRLVQLTVTEVGEQALAAVHAARVRRMQQTLETFAPDERAGLMALLERFLLAALRDEQTVRDICLHCGDEHFETCVVNEAHRALLGESVQRP